MAVLIKRVLAPVGVATLLVGAGAAGVPAGAANRAARSPGSKASAVTVSAAKPPSTWLAGMNIDATTIPQLQAAMDRHTLSSVELTRFYLRRIALLNPKLHAVITTSPTALSDARAADDHRAAGQQRALLGIPVIVKDNMDTTGMPTTAGSLALAGNTPPDAFIVRKLRAAGAIIIGKANLSEWANFRSTNSTSGWSAVGGQTNNPYGQNRLRGISRCQPLC